MRTQEDRQRILQMLAKGTISVAEADQLLSALQTSHDEEARPTQAEPVNAGMPKSPRYLRVVVEPKPGLKGDRVNVRVPFQLLRAGVKLAALLPDEARAQVDAKLGEKGINLDLSKLTPESLETLVNHLSDLTVDVDNDEETVKVFCE